MLSLLCSSPRVDDYDFDAHRKTRPGRRLSLPATNSRKKKRVAKLSIGNPTDFVHTNHVGQDLVVPAGMWDDKWRQPRLTTAPGPLRPQSQPVLMQEQTPQLQRRASLPIDHHQLPGAASPTSPVRRKPIPAYLDEPATVSPFPTIVPRQQDYPRVTDAGLVPRAEVHQPHQQPREKQLVRLLDTLPEGRVSDNPLLVTQTTKARFDGAMREIAQALRDP